MASSAGVTPRKLPKALRRSRVVDIGEACMGIPRSIQQNAGAASIEQQAGPTVDREALALVDAVGRAHSEARTVGQADLVLQVGAQVDLRVDPAGQGTGGAIWHQVQAFRTHRERNAVADGYVAAGLSRQGVTGRAIEPGQPGLDS